MLILTFEIYTYEQVFTALCTSNIAWSILTHCIYLNDIWQQ